MQRRARVPGERCLEVVSDLESGQHRFNKEPSRTYSQLYRLPRATLPASGAASDPPSAQPSRRAGWDRGIDGMVTWHLLAGGRSQTRRNTACSWKRGVSSENRDGNLSQPGSLSKGKNNHCAVCLQPTKPLSLTILEDIKANQI